VKAFVEYPDGRTEWITFQGENFALGLAAVKHTCRCGTSQFVDGGPPQAPSERDPDRICENDGIKFWYYEDDDEQTGYLHAADTA
jgi:hypothetical protein